MPRPRPCRTVTGGAPVLLLAMLVGGCLPAAAPPDRQSGPAPDGCLQNVNLEQLGPTLQRCNAVVAAHPTLPQPRHERALLHSLAGQTAAACRDSQAAATLLARLPRRPAADPLLVEEIRLRQRNCQSVVTTPPADRAPSGAAPAASAR